MFRLHDMTCFGYIEDRTDEQNLLQVHDTCALRSVVHFTYVQKCTQWRNWWNFVNSSNQQNYVSNRNWYTADGFDKFYEFGEKDEFDEIYQINQKTSVFNDVLESHPYINCFYQSWSQKGKI